jgi:hypothetical protein
MATTAIFVDDGSAENRDGDEVRVWYVTPGDDDGEPTGPHQTFSSRDAAINEAEKLAAAYGGIEVVVE